MSALGGEPELAGMAGNDVNDPKLKHRSSRNSVVSSFDYGSGACLTFRREHVSWPKSGKSPHMKSAWEAGLHRSTTTLWRCLTNLPPCRPFASVQVCVMST